MPPPHVSRRQTSEFDDSEDVENFDASVWRHAGQEKIKQLINELVGRWHWIALGLVIGLLGSFYYLAKTPKQYTAAATLLIKQQTGSVMARDEVDAIDLRTQEAMNTVAERIRRMDLLERVSSRQDVRELPGLMPQPANWMPEWLSRKLGRPPTAEVRQAPPPAASGNRGKRRLCQPKLIAADWRRP